MFFLYCYQWTDASFDFRSEFRWGTNSTSKWGELSCFKLDHNSYVLSFSNIFIQWNCFGCSGCFGMICTKDPGSLHQNTNQILKNCAVSKQYKNFGIISSHYSLSKNSQWKQVTISCAKESSPFGIHFIHWIVLFVYWKIHLVLVVGRTQKMQEVEFGQFASTKMTGNLHFFPHSLFNSLPRQDFVINEVHSLISWKWGNVAWHRFSCNWWTICRCPRSWWWHLWSYHFY